MNAKQIRTWATAAGYEVPKRGRVGRTLTVEYLKAHPAEARAMAKDKGYFVGTRGRVSQALVESLV